MYRGGGRRGKAHKTKPPVGFASGTAPARCRFFGSPAGCSRARCGFSHDQPSGGRGRSGGSGGGVGGGGKRRVQPATTPKEQQQQQQQQQQRKAKRKFGRRGRGRGRGGRVGAYGGAASSSANEEDTGGGGGGGGGSGTDSGHTVQQIPGCKRRSSTCCTSRTRKRAHFLSASVSSLVDVATNHLAYIEPICTASCYAGMHRNRLAGTHRTRLEPHAQSTHTNHPRTAHPLLQKD